MLKHFAVLPVVNVSFEYEQGESRNEDSLQAHQRQQVKTATPPKNISNACHKREKENALEGIHLQANDSSANRKACVSASPLWGWLHPTVCFKGGSGWGL